MREASSNSADPGTGRKVLVAWIAVAALVGLALFLRVYWNYDAATGDGFVLSSGSDPYYHKRAIDYIQDNGWSILTRDPMLNYPYGSTNPNPPLFQYSVAVTGAALAPFFDGDLETATWWAFEWAPAIWGALTIIPAYLIGRDVFNRRTGILAAFVLAVSTSHIDHTSLGAADHDSMLLFFATFGFWTYIRAIQQFRGDGNWVAKWSNGADVSAGLGRFFRERRGALGWSVLTGVLVGAVALIWKGFPYLVGVMFAYAALQMVVDHWRNKDSLGVWFGTLVAFLIATLLALPFYGAANVAGFLKPVWFLILAHFLMGAVMVPTRDMPTILVIPAGIALAGVLAAALYFLANDVWRSLLYATVYFKQTSLYKTIAEAHPADFNTMVFGIGPVTFFFALGGLVMLALTARKNPTRASLFMIVWGVIAVYMAHSAVRFLFNATPIMAILGAWAIMLCLDWVDFASIGKTMRGAGSFWGGMRRAVSWLHVTTAVLVALLLVFPSVFLAVDAGTPPQYEADASEAADSDFVKNFVDKRLGAFGQGYLPSYWTNGLDNLSALDDYGSAPGNLANRPAFLSWWDYGHWAIAVGDHPAVADNFQNGYEYAAAFLLSQNETHSVQLLAARSLPRTDGAGTTISPGLLDEATSKRLLVEAGVNASDVDATYVQLTSWKFAPALTLDKAVALEELVTGATKTPERPDGVRIRYFATDIRMLPYDLPSTPSIEQSSIYYAPIILGGENVRPPGCAEAEFPTDKIPSCYVQLFIRAGNQLLTEEEFERKIKDVLRNPNFQATGSKYEFKAPFFNSMYYRGFVGSPVDATRPVEGDQVDRALQLPQPGYGLEHWRLVISNDQLRIMEYYKGAVVKGTVKEEGRALAGLSVTAYDDAGHFLWESLTDAGKAAIQPTDLNVPHATTRTNGAGEFTIRVPFSTVSNTTLVVTDGGVELGRFSIPVSRADAETEKEITHDFTVQKGDVEGRVFFDKNGNGAYNASDGDVAESGLDVRIQDKRATTDADGKFAIADVSPGARAISINSSKYSVASSATSVNVKPGETVTHDLPLTLRSMGVQGTVRVDKDGDGTADADVTASSVIVSFTPTAGSTGKLAAPRTDANATYRADVTPGEYRVTANFTAEGVTYSAETTFVVPFRAEGATSATLDLLLARRT